MKCFVMMIVKSGAEKVLISIEPADAATPATQTRDLYYDFLESLCALADAPASRLHGKGTKQHRSMDVTLRLQLRL